MRFGIFGCRHAHISMFIDEMLDLGHELVGICEKEPDIAKGIAANYKVQLMTNEVDFFALNPDVVGTSAINNEKINIIEVCNEHGVHVMADKPIVTNMRDYQRLKVIMEEGKIVIGLMLTERFNPPVYTLWNMIKTGLLGELVSFTFTKPHKLNEKLRPSWHFSKEQNGGIAIDLLVHDFDLLRWFTGSQVDDCCGYVKKKEYQHLPDFFDSVHAVVKMGSGVIATLEADWWIPDAYWTWGDGRIFCVGTLGRAEVRTTGDLLQDKNPYGMIVTKEQDLHIYENINPPVTLAEDFLNRIKGKKDIIINAIDILSSTYDTILADEKLEIIR